jgi:uncharacterized membrane-anchored protein YhcB (DUF1043 family)
MGTIEMDINTALNIVILIMGFWLTRYVKQQDIFQKNTTAYQVSTTKEMNEIKFNYLDRFKKQSDESLNHKAELIDKINLVEHNLTKLLTDKLS